MEHYALRKVHHLMIGWIQFSYITNELITMAEDKLRDANLKTEQKFYFDMLKHNGVKSSRVSLVACFTTKADSRILWDAYTMHRKDRAAERYNGVCIEFDK